MGCLLLFLGKADNAFRPACIAVFALLDRIIARKPRTMRELNEAWFGEYRPTFAHYDSHRYHSLNISPLFEEKRTVEFRFGNGTTHAGEARSMASFCLAMVAKAKLARAASGRNPREYNETTARFDFRVALLHGLLADHDLVGPGGHDMVHGLAFPDAGGNHDFTPFREGNCLLGTSKRTWRPPRTPCAFT